MGSFAADISRWITKTKIKGALVLKKVAFDGLRGVILRSPVDTGRFRGNWRVAINETALEVEPNKFDKSGGGSLAAGSNVMAKAKWTDAIYITNNLPYGPKLEMGWSQQAPHGMLHLTVAELKANLQTNLARVA